MNKILTILTAVTLLGALAAVAPADVMTYDGQGLREIVRLQAPGQLSDNQRVYAGQNRISYQGDDFLAWCVDVDHYAGSSSVTELPLSTLPNADRVAFLYETYADTVSTNRQAAALAVAIWEVINETDSVFDVTDATGSFWITDNAGVAADANGLLATMPASYAPSTILTVLHSQTKQDMLIGTGVDIPEPGTIVLLLGGGVLLAVRQHRRTA